MNSPTPDLSEATRWQAAIAGAAVEIATYALGFSGAEVSPATPLDATDLVGTPDSCRAIAAAMLQTTTPETLTMADIADAVGETLNMLGGAVKRRVQSAGNELELGLPIFMIGHIQRTNHISITALPTKLGPIQMYVLVIGRRG